MSSPSEFCMCFTTQRKVSGVWVCTRLLPETCAMRKSVSSRIGDAVSCAAGAALRRDATCRAHSSRFYVLSSSPNNNNNTNKWQTREPPVSGAVTRRDRSGSIESEGKVGQHLHAASGRLPAMPTNCAQPTERDGRLDIGDAEWKAKLSPQQFRVLRQKGTDPRGMHYDKFFKEGTYACAACNSVLYTSAMKFECPCGWPAFFDCVPKAVREEPDADGHRVEILCNACNGHLGHVFRGEGFDNPPPNERHCVNSTSIVFTSAS